MAKSKRTFDSQNELDSWLNSLSPAARDYLAMLDDSEQPKVVRPKGRRGRKPSEPKEIVIRCEGPNAFTPRAAHGFLQARLKGLTIGKDKIIVINGENRRLLTLTQEENGDYRCDGVVAKSLILSDRPAIVQEIAERVTLAKVELVSR